MEKKELLKNVGLFSNLNEKALKAIAKACVEKSFSKGEAIVEQGKGGIGLFMIVSGSAKVVKKTAGGAEFEVAIQGPGDFIGEIAVFDDAPRSASVIALEDTECLVLASWHFKTIMRLNPEIALEVVSVLVKRFRETNEKLISLSTA